MSTKTDEVKYPGVTVSLIGSDGNAMAIVGKVVGELKRAGYREESKEFAKEALSGDYNHVLQTCVKWVNVE